MARTKEFKSAYRILNGPYGILRHPLYIGNFFLVTGTIFLYNPPQWLKIFVVVSFVIEYSIIIIAEEEYLKNLPSRAIKFSFKNVKSEISTILTMAVIYLIHFWILALK